MASPEFAEEAGKAGFFVGLGIALLKLVETLLRRADKRERKTLDDIDQSLEVGAKIRSELRGLADTYHRRAVSAETETERMQGLLISMQRTLTDEKALREETQRELRDMKIRNGIKVIPPPGGNEKGPE